MQSFRHDDIVDLSPDERANEGIFLSFQYPVEIPGVSITNFMRTAINAQREFRGEDPIPAGEFLKKMEEKKKLVDIHEKLTNRSVNEGFSGGEKKKNEIFQMAMLEPTLAILDETDSGLDVDALRIVTKGINAFKGEQKGILVITHYNRMLEYLQPDEVIVLVNGNIVATGGKELAAQIEKEGFSKWSKNNK